MLYGALACLHVGMLEWQKIFLGDWTCNDLSDENSGSSHWCRGPCVRKLFTRLIMYLPSQNKNIVLYCIVLYCIVLYCIVLCTRAKDTIHTLRLLAGSATTFFLLFLSSDYRGISGLSCVIAKVYNLLILNRIREPIISLQLRDNWLFEEFLKKQRETVSQQLSLSSISRRRFTRSVGENVQDPSGLWDYI